jgi:putative sigma-54 modulation protein
MQVLVTFRHIQPTQALRQYAEGKIDKLLKYLHRPIEAHVIFSVDKHRHIAEVILTADHGTFNAKEETADLYSAIDLATSKIERQVKKLATKRQARKHAGNSGAGDSVASPRAARPSIRTQRVSVEPMTVRDAVRRATRDDADFLIFHNLASETLNVLHRRKDGSYVLLEPEGVER